MASGFEPYSALEYEFFVFEETPHSVREKNYRNLKPISPGFFGYSILRNSVFADFYHELLAMCERMDMPIEGLHTETGAGVLEAAIAFDKSQASADKAALFKTFTKVLAQRRGWMATFMAKWSKDWPGQSGHLHLSLKDKKGKGVFHDPKAPHGMSDTMRHFLARPAGADAAGPGDGRADGELLYAAHPRLLGADARDLGRREPDLRPPRHPRLGEIATHRVPHRRRRRKSLSGNSPRRSAPGFGASRTSSSRTAPVEGNSYAKEHPAKIGLPATLWDAAQRLKASKAARELFGDGFVEHYAATREWEERENRKHISDWQLNRYFEII